MKSLISIVLIILGLFIGSCGLAEEKVTTGSGSEGTIECEGRVCDTLDTYEITLDGGELLINRFGDSLFLEKGFEPHSISFRSWRCSYCKGYETIRITSEDGTELGKIRHHVTGNDGNSKPVDISNWKDYRKTIIDWPGKRKVTVIRN